MSDLYTRLVAGAIFPLHERLKHHDSVSRRIELERTQWLSRPELEALQVQKLRRFMARIAEIPYYQVQFRKHGVSAADGDIRASLTRLPLLDKSLIRQHGEAMKRPGSMLQKFSTGGSSGEPLTFWLGERISHDVAAKWRVTRWWDVDIGDRELVLWGSPIEVKAQDRAKQLRDWLLRTELLSAFDLSAAGMQHFISRYRQCRPRMLFGYPSAFFRIAKYAKAEGISLGSTDLRVVFVTAERLYPEQRAAIQDCFGAPVANGYGARDAGFLVHECPKGGMHIMAEDVIIETLDSRGQATAPGAAGEITVTHLATSDFPFVRYRTGDVGVLSEETCPCGRGLPVLSEIQGRTTDFVVAHDGTAMHGLAVIYVVREIEGIDSFRIIQHSRDELEVLIVSAGWSAEKTRRVVNGMRARLGEAVSVSVKQVDEIPTEPNGKFRYVISKVSA